MKPYLVDAVPQWNTESLDPLKISRVTFNEPGMGIDIKGHLQDATLKGLGSYKITGAKSNIEVS